MKLIRDEVFLTTSEVALMFGVTARTIMRWSSPSPDREEPHLNPVKGPNKRLLFRKQEVDRIIDSYFGPATPKQSHLQSTPHLAGASSRKHSHSHANAALHSSGS